LAGDIFDKMPDANTVLSFRRHASNTKGIFYLYGNHDPERIGDWLKVAVANGRCEHLGWFRLGANEEDEDAKLEGFTQEVPFDFEEGVFLRGIDYQETREKLQEALDKLDPIDTFDNRPEVLILHQACECLCPPNMSAELFDGMIPEWVDLVLSGHVHKFGTATIRRKDGEEIPLVSLGSTHYLSVDESPVKKMFAICSDGLYSKRLEVRKKRTVDARELSEAELRKLCIEEIVPLLPSKTKKVARPIDVPIYRFVYESAAIPSFRKIVETCLEDYQIHCFYKDMSDLSVSVIEVEESFVSGNADAMEFLKANETDEDIKGIVDALLTRPISGDVYTELKKSYLSVG
jgi:DNA repair exonuclease SbcCD nuclease subunit